jgi:hypothetical protein
MTLAIGFPVLRSQTIVVSRLIGNSNGSEIGSA